MESGDAGSQIRIDMSIRITMRDGTRLAAIGYFPAAAGPSGPVIFTLTPYTADSYHERGMYFARAGFAFLCVDVRGRGNSEGLFVPFLNDAADAHDIVEWVAVQPFCNGKVGMWGGSYGGFTQWAAAKSRPCHLATIAPAASAAVGVDFPWRKNISYQYVLQWLAYVSGNALQTTLFADQSFWRAYWRARFENGEPFTSLAQGLGLNLQPARDWASHSTLGPYFDAARLFPDDYRAVDIPVLTITGSYDDDQPGAMAHYRAHLQNAGPSARHFLVMGPWDHLGTRTPRLSVGGVTFGPNSLVDLPLLHAQWYRWTMSGGPRPEFLRDNVAVYVIGRDEWRYAARLQDLTGEAVPFYLTADQNPDRVFHSGRLEREPPGAQRAFGAYLYDPRDTSLAALEASLDPEDPAEQRLVLAQDGKNLVYHTAPFEEPFDLVGAFAFDAWIAIDQPDTDIQVRVYEITMNGQSVLLSMDQLRCRHRGGPDTDDLVGSDQPFFYRFDDFTYMARRIAAGSRLRLVIGPLNSIYAQKNFNSPKPVSEHTMADARPVTVRLFHHAERPSVLHVPVGEGSRA